MPRRGPALEDAAVKDERLKAQQERLRQQRIRLLRGELKATLERLHAIRRELRLLGDHGSRVTTGGTDWNEVFERLGSRFSAKEMAGMTGASPGLVASIVHRWRTHGRAVATGRGQYRKARAATTR
jgi:phage-related minor tail protein